MVQFPGYYESSTTAIEKVHFNIHQLFLMRFKIKLVTNI